MTLLKEVLTSGPATGKIALVNFSTFSKKVAEAYQARPKYEEEYVKSWKVLMKNLQTMYKRLQSKFTFEFTDEDPYTSKEQMAKEVQETGVLKIYKGHSEHPIWTPEENWVFRAVHDALGHLAGYEKGKGHAFTLRGEIGVYNRQVKTISPEARVALFTEVVGQACTSLVTGSFPVQKICKLHGFDYENVGEINETVYLQNFPEKQQEDLKLAAHYAGDSMSFLIRAMEAKDELYPCKKCGRWIDPQLEGKSDTDPEVKYNDGGKEDPISPGMDGLCYECDVYGHP